MIGSWTRTTLALTVALIPAGVAHAADSDVVSPASVASMQAERCVDCHRGVVQDYARSGMARALGPIEDGELKGLGRVEDKPAGFTYSLSQNERGAQLSESWKSGSGADRHTVRKTSPLLFRIGAGILDRSYAARFGEAMWFAPLEVLSTSEERARHVALAPAHMMNSGMRLSVPITIECLACHTGELPPESYPNNLVPEGDWKPSGIACDVCHAQTDAHADWRELEASGEAPQNADPILRHEQLGLNESLSLCARCHLQGDARIALNADSRGISAPGVDMLKEWAVYLPKNSDRDVAFVSQTERMLLSRCFTESLEAEPLTCVSCHDPHRSATDAEERSALRRACLTCHTASEAEAPKQGSMCSMPVQERPAERDCVDCHMPRTRVFDVDAVLIRDHFVRVEPVVATPEELRIKHCTDGMLAPFVWPGGDASALEADFGLQMMAALIGGQPEIARDWADMPMGELSRELPNFHHLKGRMLEELGRNDAARESYARALVLDPGAAETRVNLGLVLGVLGEVERGIEMLDAVIVDHPRAEGAYRNRGILKLQLDDEAGFIADLKSAHRIVPRGVLARAISSYYVKSGERDEAMGWEQEARRLEP